MNINVFEDADNTIVQLSDLNKFKICDHDKTLSYDQSHGCQSDFSGNCSSQIWTKRPDDQHLELHSRGMAGLHHHWLCLCWNPKLETWTRLQHLLSWDWQYCDCSSDRHWRKRSVRTRPMGRSRSMGRHHNAVEERNLQDDWHKRAGDESQAIQWFAFESLLCAAQWKRRHFLG